jgi:hypothetical protein
MQIRMYADRFSQSCLPSQLFEVEVACTDPPPPRRISKLSRRYHRLKKSMPVISVDTNHPAASAARRMAREWMTPRAPTRMLPPRVAKTNATAVMHDALAPAPRHQCVDAASFAAASFASTAASAARNVALTGALSVNSSSSSDSDDSKMSGGEGAAVGRKSTGLTDFVDIGLVESPFQHTCL